MPTLNLNEILDPTTYISPLPLVIQMEAYGGSTVRSTSGDAIASSQISTTEGTSTLASTTNYFAQTTLLGTNTLTAFYQGTPDSNAVGSTLADYAAMFPGGYTTTQLAGRANASAQNIHSNTGITIGRRGQRQRATFLTSGTTLRIHHRAHLVHTEGFALTTRTTASEPGTNNSGQVCYNERANRLLVVNASTSGTYRAHVYTNPNINLNSPSYKVGDLFKFVSDAFSGLNGASYFYNDFTWSTTGSTSYAESQYHNKFVLGDNGIVGMFRMTPNNQAVAANMTLNPAGTTTTVTSLWTSALTTSYGIENGNLYGNRTTIDWSNEFVAAYCSYYYYGCGIKLVFFYTADPSKYYVYTYDDSSSGVSIAPQGPHGFLVKFNSTNVDSTGTRVYSMNPADMRRSGVNMNGAGVSNGGTVSLLNPWWGYDQYGSSTMYNVFRTASSWNSPMKTSLQTKDFFGS